MFESAKITSAVISSCSQSNVARVGRSPTGNDLTMDFMDRRRTLGVATRLRTITRMGTITGRFGAGNDATVPCGRVRQSGSRWTGTVSAHLRRIRMGKRCVWW